MGSPGIEIVGPSNEAQTKRNSPLQHPFTTEQKQWLTTAGKKHPCSQDNAPILHWTDEELRFSNPSWSGQVRELARKTCKAMGMNVESPSFCDPTFYKMLLFEAGSSDAATINLMNPQKPGLVAALLIFPPSIHTGGVIQVQHHGSSSVMSTKNYDFSKEGAFELSYLTLLADSRYSVQPLLTGERICFIYTICAPTTVAAKVLAVDFKAEARLVEEVTLASTRWANELQHVSSTITTKHCLVIPTEVSHPSSSFQRLKDGQLEWTGGDANLMSLLNAAIGQGADVDWSLGTLVRSHSFSPARNESLLLQQDFPSMPENVFRDLKPKTPTDGCKRFDVNLDSFKGTLKMKEECILPKGFFEKHEPRLTIVNDSYSARYNDESVRRVHGPLSCVVVWPRSKTWKVVGYYDLAFPNRVQHLEESCRERFSGAQHLQTNRELLREMLKTVSYDSLEKEDSLKQTVTLIRKLEDKEAAQELTTQILSGRSLNPSVVQGFLQHGLPELKMLLGDTWKKPMTDYIKSRSISRVAQLGVALTDSPDVVTAFVDRIAGLTQTELLEDALGIESYYYRFSHGCNWPKHSLGSILIAYTSKENGMDKTVLSKFISVFATAFARADRQLTDSATESLLQHLYSKDQLKEVAQSIGLSSCLAGIVEKAPLAHLDQILKCVLSTEKNTYSGRSTLVKFALDFVEGVPIDASFTKQFVKGFAKRVVGDGSASQTRHLATCIRCFDEYDPYGHSELRNLPVWSQDSVVEFLRFMCEQYEDDDKAETISAIVSSLASALALERSSVSSAFSRLYNNYLSKLGLTALANAVQLDDLFKKLLGDMDVDVAVAFWIKLAEGDGQDAASFNADLRKTTLIALCHKLLGREGKMTMPKLVESIDQGRWPANSFGLILRSLCEDCGTAPETKMIVLELVKKIYQAILKTKLKPIKSEESQCDRLLHSKDLDIAFNYCGVEAVAKLLREIFDETEMRELAAFIIHFSSVVVEQGAASSTNRDSGIGAVARSLRQLETAEAASDTLDTFLRDLHSRFCLAIETSAYVTFCDLLKWPRNALKIILSLLGRKAGQSQNNAAATTSDSFPMPADVAVFLERVCKAMSMMTWDRADAALGPEDFDVAIRCCGTTEIARRLRPIIEGCISDGKPSVAISLVSHANLKNKTEEAEWLYPLLAKILKSLVESKNCLQSWDNKAILYMLNIAATLDEEASATWSAAWVLQSKDSATEETKQALLSMDIDRLMNFLAQAEALFSSKTLQSRLASSVLKDVCDSVIGRLSGLKMASPKNRPAESWAITLPESGHVSLRHVPFDVEVFLRSPCRRSFLDYAPKDSHTSIRQVIRYESSIKAEFFQIHGRGKYL
jgi:hypothetical protein